MKEVVRNKEIDVVGILLRILREKKVLAVFLCVFSAVGVIVALSLPKSYTSNVVLAPELSTGGLAMSESLGDLASSFGFDLGGKSSMDAIYPELYPDIFMSTEFVMGLFDIPVRLKEDNSVKSYYEHIIQDTKVPFWAYPKIWLVDLFKKNDDTLPAKSGGKDVFRISKKDFDMCDAIRNNINCIVDKKTSVITISVTDQDPLVSAIVADTLQNRLQEYIINYRTKKARNDYDYYKKLYAESKNAYLKAQNVYASYADANQDVFLESCKAKQDELENEMQLRYNVYSQMSAQLQNAKAKIQERTPVFTIMERPIMPYKATSTPRSVIVMLFFMLGFIADGLWVCIIRDKIKK